MEFHEKLQELRKQKNLTQEELSEILFVSRTAISKWESGRGYPSIDSLKAIAEFFGVTIDELLSNRELICIAEKDSHQKTQHIVCPRIALHFPNTSAARRIFSMTGTPKGHRFSQAPQDKHSPPWWGRTA